MHLLRRALLVAIAAVASPALAANTYYVSPAGVDTGNTTGDISHPFLTFSKAITTAVAGDTIYARGNAGNFSLSSVINISKSGTAALPFNLLAYPSDPSPILDFTNEGSGARGISLAGNYWRIRGLTVQKAHDNGVFVGGSYNVLDRLIVRQNQDSGVQISQSGSLVPSNNLVLNTDSYQNYDPANHGENADGFAVKFRGLGPGNVLRGTRAWGNSDDGYDFWEAASGVTVENAWAFRNGINTFGDGSFAGDGNGIKLGHDSGTHVLKNMLIWANPANGVDVNGNATQIELPAEPITHGVKVYNTTAYNNGAKNFNFDESYAHELKNNLSFTGSVTVLAGNVADHNSWNGVSGIGTSSFYSLNDALATGPRLPDGNLPISGFLRPKPGTSLIDAGVNVGSPCTGAAPDLGAFELNMPLPGDANLDSKVDVTDLGVLATNWQLPGTWTGGDFNFDGVVDVTDLGMLATNWQAGAGGSLNQALAAVGLSGVPLPEPAGVGLIVLAAYLTHCRRRSK